MLRLDEVVDDALVELGLDETVEDASVTIGDRVLVGVPEIDAEGLDSLVLESVVDELDEEEESVEVDVRVSLEPDAPDVELARPKVPEAVGAVDDAGAVDDGGFKVVIGNLDDVRFVVAIVEPDDVEFVGKTDEPDDPEPGVLNTGELVELDAPDVELGRLGDPDLVEVADKPNDWKSVELNDGEDAPDVEVSKPVSVELTGSRDGKTSDETDGTTSDETDGTTSDETEGTTSDETELTDDKTSVGPRSVDVKLGTLVSVEIVEELVESDDELVESDDEELVDEADVGVWTTYVPAVSSRVGYIKMVFVVEPEMGSTAVYVVWSTGPLYAVVAGVTTKVVGSVMAARRRFIPLGVTVRVPVVVSPE